MLAEAPVTMLDVSELGPAAATRCLEQQLPIDSHDKESFWTSARQAAVMGSAAFSMNSYVSGKLFCISVNTS